MLFFFQSIVCFAMQDIACHFCWYSWDLRCYGIAWHRITYTPPFPPPAPLPLKVAFASVKFYYQIKLRSFCYSKLKSVMFRIVGMWYCYDRKVLFQRNVLMTLLHSLIFRRTLIEYRQTHRTTVNDCTATRSMSENISSVLGNRRTGIWQ